MSFFDDEIRINPVQIAALVIVAALIWKLVLKK